MAFVQETDRPALEKKKPAGSLSRMNSQRKRKQRSVHRELIRQKNCPAGSLSLETFRLIFFRQDWIFKERMFLFQRKCELNGILELTSGGRDGRRRKALGNALSGLYGID